MLLPKIYPIADKTQSKLSHAHQTEEFINKGAKIIQLRNKSSLSEDFYQSAIQAIRIAHKSETKIIINDRVDLAIAVNADGVHLGQDDFPPEKARVLLGKKVIIGYSTHNQQQALAALELPINYLAIGPIFKTMSKECRDPAIGLEGISKIRKAIGDFPMVAIGGINYSNFCDVLSAGADSVAIITGLLNDDGEIDKDINKYFLSANC